MDRWAFMSKRKASEVSHWAYVCTILDQNIRRNRNTSVYIGRWHLNAVNWPVIKCSNEGIRVD
jgi:hypothetical protein